VIPGITDPGVLAEGVAYSERKRAFYIMDSPSNWDVDTPSTGGSANSPVDGLSVVPVPSSTNAAIYYPWLVTTDPVTGAKTDSPPSGFVAGIYATEDASYGVWKSPAGLETTLNGTLGVVPTGVMTDNQQGVLNGHAINCLRVFPPLTPVVYGARTLAHNNPAQRDQWGYIAVRRMALFLEQSLYNNLTWAVFQPNDTPLWHAITQEVSAFMLSLFRQGAFAGTKPSEAFLVVCDNTTTTQSDIDNGIVNVLVGFAPLKPAEFVVVQIAQLAGQTSS
jgi:phage tail sheath protein FI